MSKAVKGCLHVVRDVVEKLSHRENKTSTLGTVQCFNSIRCSHMVLEVLIVLKHILKPRPRTRVVSYLICSETCSSGLLFNVIIKDLLLAVLMVMMTTRVRIMTFT